MTALAAFEFVMKRSIWLAGMARLRAYAVGTVPIRMSMMRPMPFWPSLEPWKKLTSVQVRAPDPPGGWLVAFRLGVERHITNHELQRQQQHGRQCKPEQRRQQQRLANIGGLRPIDSGGPVAATQERVGNTHSDDRA